MHTREWLDKLFPFTPMDPANREYKVQWLAKGLLMKEKINVFFGMEKAGKSRLLGWMMVHMYAKAKLFGQTTKDPGKTLYLAGEETKEEVTARLMYYQKVAALDNANIPWAKRIEFCEAAGMRLDRKQQRDWLRGRIESGLFETVIIDPLRRVHGASESSNDEMAPIANDMREWTNRYGVTLLMIHHTGKLSVDDDETRIATWSRGATDLPAVLDWALYAKRTTTGKGKADRIKLFRKGRAPKEDPLNLVDDGDRFLPSGYYDKENGRE